MAIRKISEIRRQEILEHFYDVIKKEGIEGASITKIANHMGVNRGLITHYFKSKEDMTIELVNLVVNKFEETLVLPKLDGIGDPEKRFAEILNILFDLENVKQLDIDVFYACYALSFRDKRIKKLILQMGHRLRNYLLKEMRAYLEAGILKEKDPERAADLLIVLMEGYSIFYSDYGFGEEYLRTMGQYLKGVALQLLREGM